MKTVWILTVILSLGATSCGRLSMYKGKPVDSSLPKQQSADSGALPDFARISIHELLGSPFSDVDSFIDTAKQKVFTAQADEFINTTPNAVVLWVKSSASIDAQGAWIGYNYSIYNSEGVYSLNGLEVNHPQDGVKENKDPTQPWVPIIVKPQESVQLSWNMGLLSGFLLCTAGEGGTGIGDGGHGHYNYYQAVGSLTREIRVAPLAVEELEATADDVSQDRSRVYVIRKETLPLVSAQAGDIPEWARPYTRRGLCPSHS